MGGGDSGGSCVPVEGGNCACLGGEVLEAVQFRGHLVSTLKLCHLDLPFPGGCRGASVYINIDGVAGSGSWYKQVLTSVVPTDYWGRGSPWVGHSQGVVEAVTQLGTVSLGSCR